MKIFLERMANIFVLTDVEKPRVQYIRYLYCKKKNDFRLDIVRTYLMVWLPLYTEIKINKW